MCEDHLSSFIDTVLQNVPLMVEPNIVSAAIGACHGQYGTTTCRDNLVGRACEGAGNFGGLGSTIDMPGESHDGDALIADGIERKFHSRL